ncbi:hypothetical protein TruAng_007634 [Truncatella angustata]|nr:hypothetical protein TruAng_007634 [Truncatella angustata]
MICEDCRNLTQRNCDFQNSPKDERRLRPDLIPVDKDNPRLVTFFLYVLADKRLSMDSAEDFNMMYLRVSIMELRMEFRVRPMGDYFLTKRPSGDDCNTRTGTSFVIAAEWFHECMAEHDLCATLNVPRDWIPHRLLDVNPRSSSLDMIKLEQTKDWQQPQRYATLSHCWGALKPRRLLINTEREFLRGILLGSLPKTFQEAVRTVRTLGIQYLWIDSLCIIQDSELDWNIESSLMAYVYGGSTLNIAAAASDDCAGGLFQNRPASYFGPCLLSIMSRDESTLLPYQIHDEDLWDFEFETAKLNTRAWVMQERLLSPRTLAFTKTQLFWECRSNDDYEPG